MNSRTETVSIKAPAVRKQRLFTIGFFTVVAIAMVGWLSALGWAAIAVAKWLLA